MCVETPLCRKCGSEMILELIDIGNPVVVVKEYFMCCNNDPSHSLGGAYLDYVKNKMNKDAKTATISTEKSKWQ